MDSGTPKQPLNAGDRDQRIALQSPTETNDGGSLSISYKTVATVWGKVISWKGYAALEAARTNAREINRIGIPYRKDVTDKWRVVWNGQAYNIIHVDRSEARRGDLWITTQLVGAL